MIEKSDDNCEKMALYTVDADLFPGCKNPADYPESIRDLNQKVTLCPDYIWAYHDPDVTIKEGSDNEIIPTTPEAVTATYHIIVKNVINLEGAANLHGALSGMAGTLSLSDNYAGGAPVIHPFQIRKDGIKSLSAKFTTFGKFPDNSLSSIFFLFAQLKDGKRILFQSDVTKQIAKAPDKMDVWIIIDSITLPIPDDDPGAFDVSVDGWNDIRINIQS